MYLVLSIGINLVTLVHGFPKLSICIKLVLINWPRQFWYISIGNFVRQVFPISKFVFFLFYLLGYAIV